MDDISYIHGKHVSLHVWTFLAAYVLILLFFNCVDVYHQYFFTKGMIPAIYNLFRIGLIASLLWLFYALGDFLLKRIMQNPDRNPYTLSSFLQGFFTGVGIWHVVLFALGLAGLYQRWLMVVLTLLVFLCSLPRLNGWLQRASIRSSSIYWPGCLLVTGAVLVFLMTKGLYPTGGHDYFNHYFPYYRMVTESGSLLPNAVWYHFYYSKGDGLFFLAMLLTDPLAPQLATSAMIFAGAGVVFQVLRGRSTWRLLPWVSVALFLLFLVYTPGELRYWQQGGWSELEKMHEPAAMLVLGMLWQVINLIKASDQRVWGVTLCFTLLALSLINAPMSMFAAVYVSCLTIYFYQQRALSRWLALSVVICGGSLAVQWTINYYLTGLPDDKQLFLYWPIINFTKINDWGLSLELMLFHMGKTSMLGHQLPVTRVITRLASYLRLDIWGVILCLPLLLAWYKSTTLERVAPRVFGSFLLCIALLSIIVGRDQPVSYYRFTTFTYAPMLCFCLLLCAGQMHQVSRRLLLLLSCLMGLWMLMAVQTDYGKKATRTHDMVVDLDAVIRNSLSYMSGKYSIADAYRHQEGWPASMPWGGIYPAAESAWKLLPPKTRIWSFNIHSYCMLPDCDMEGFMSFRFSPHAEAVYFGNPEIAKSWLKQEHLNYFFISTSLPIYDPLPRSPLFAPATIANYLGIVWTDGESALLTWKEQAVMDIDSKWLRHYNQRVNESGAVHSFPFDSIQAVFKKLHAEGTLKQSDLPWSFTLKG